MIRCKLTGLIFGLLLSCFSYSEATTNITESTSGAFGTTVSSESSGNADGMNALSIVGESSINVNGVNNTIDIVGGIGGDYTLTASGIRTGSASGGDAAHLDFSSATDTFVASNALFQGGQGGRVSGLSGNRLNADGGSGIVSEHGTLRVSANSTGGNGGDVIGSGASATLSAGGGHGVDVNFSFADLELHENSIFSGGDGGNIDASTGSNSTGTAVGGNGLNLRWFPGFFNDDKPLNLNDGLYQGGDGGFLKDTVESSADGGSGFFLHGGQSVFISNGVFRGGSGGDIYSYVADEASADGRFFDVFRRCTRSCRCAVRV